MNWIWQRNLHSHPLLHPSIPPLSSLESSHAPATLRSSAAVFGKINWATGEMTSAGLRGEVSVCLLLFPDPSPSLWTKRQSTHTYTQWLLYWDRTDVCVCGSDPGNGRNVEGQCQSSGRSTCLPRRTQRVEARHISYCTCTCNTQIIAYHTHTIHICCLFGTSDYTETHFVL